MAFIHYLFLGHFEHDGEGVRFSKSPGDPVYRPVVGSPLDREAVNATLREVQGAEVDGFDFPESWTIWWKDGYLICDKYTRSQEAIRFVSRFVERTGCDIYDVGAHGAITLHDWLAAMQTHAEA